MLIVNQIMCSGKRIPWRMSFSAFSRLFLICSLYAVFAGTAYGQKQEEDFYYQDSQNKGVPRIYFVSFAEILVYSKKLDGKIVETHGFCSDNERSQFFIFQNKEASDHMVERESIELRYSGKSFNFDFHLTEPEYAKSREFFTNKYCEVIGRYSNDDSTGHGTTIPPHGFIEVISLRGGAARK